MSRHITMVRITSWACARGGPVHVVRPGGFEPPTCGLRVRCSAVELEAQEGVYAIVDARFHSDDRICGDRG